MVLLPAGCNALPAAGGLALSLSMMLLSGRWQLVLPAGCLPILICSARLWPEDTCNPLRTPYTLCACGRRTRVIPRGSLTPCAPVAWGHE